jgi:hypothetical protein
MMIATWVVGKECRFVDLGPKLECAGFDFIVVVMAESVDSKDKIYTDFCRLADGHHEDLPAVAAVMKEKAVFIVSEKIFVVVHRAKVGSCKYVLKRLLTRPTFSTDDADPVRFATVTFELCNAVENLRHINIGILDVSGPVSVVDRQSLVRWIVMDRIAIVGGFWGWDPKLVTAVAEGAGAIGNNPFYQDLWIHWNRQNIQTGSMWECVAYPSYFLFFGQYSSMRWVKEAPCLPDDFELGTDILDDATAVADLPWWGGDDMGSPAVPNLGKITMKDPTFPKWCSHTFQTVVWLGTSVQGKDARKRWKASVFQSKEWWS